MANTIRKFAQKAQFRTDEQAGATLAAPLTSSYKIFDPADQPQAYDGREGFGNTPGFTDKLAGGERVAQIKQVQTLETDDSPSAAEKKAYTNL